MYIYIYICIEREREIILLSAASGVAPGGRAGLRGYRRGGARIIQGAQHSLFSARLSTRLSKTLRKTLQNSPLYFSARLSAILRKTSTRIAQKNIKILDREIPYLGTWDFSSDLKRQGGYKHGSRDTEITPNRRAPSEAPLRRNQYLYIYIYIYIYMYV